MTHSASEANYTQMWCGLRVPTAITPLVALGRPDAANLRAGSNQILVLQCATVSSASQIHCVRRVDANSTRSWVSLDASSRGTRSDAYFQTTGLTMAKTRIASVDEYIASQPETAQRVLKRVRSIIRKAVPDAQETISYGIPTYKLDGRYVLYFAGWKQHYSVYPSTDRLVAAFKNDLAPYEVSGKGTIRFPLSEPIPVKLIEGIAKFRAREVVEHQKAARAAAKKR